MRSKPIEQLSMDDLNQLIADRFPEGRHLEYKVDVPVSAEEQKRQRAASPDKVPEDRGWLNGKALAPYGRDSILEELVAFANADGGTIILGMNETKDKPPRASSLNPLPQVFDLERRLRDAIIDCIEPRLPSVSVKAIQGDEDGRGAIALEVAASNVGPHWVRNTRRATVRREDRCDLLSMPEVHDMVLRNARRFDGVERKLTEASAAFLGEIDARVWRSISKSTPAVNFREGVKDALPALNRSVFAMQISLVPHSPLGIPRLENLEGARPRPDSICVNENGALTKTGLIDVCLPEIYGRKILGGVLSDNESDLVNIKHQVSREGDIYSGLFFIAESEHVLAGLDLFLGMMGTVLGIYDKLRIMAGMSHQPAEVGITIATRNKVYVGDLNGRRYLGGAKYAIGEELVFPRFTVGDTGGFTTTLQSAGEDLLNAGGLPASRMPLVSWMSYD